MAPGCKLFYPLLTLLVLGSSAGCSSTGLLAGPTGWFHRHSIARADEKNPAVRVVSMWRQTEGKGLQGMHERGFSGQVYFFTGQNDSPVAVDGDVRIYLFDDTGTADEQTRPIHQFDFVDGAWQYQLDESQFGVVYNVFVPYSRGGTQEANCALRVRLTRPDGSILFSDLTAVKLNGAARADKEPVTASSPRPSVAEFRVSDAQLPTTHPEGLRGETIGIQSPGDSFRVADHAKMPTESLDPREARIRELESRLARFSQHEQNDQSLSQTQISSRSGGSRQPSGDDRVDPATDGVQHAGYELDRTSRTVDESFLRASFDAPPQRRTTLNDPADSSRRGDQRMNASDVFSMNPDAVGGAYSELNDASTNPVEDHQSDANLQIHNLSRPLTRSPQQQSRAESPPRPLNLTRVDSPWNDVTE